MSLPVLVAEFFDRFFIITNLPNEQDLDIVIRKELGENISLLDPSLIYSGLLTELLNWLKHTNKIKHSEGTFISESEANNLMESIETKLSELVVSGITRDIVADVSEIQFKFDDINQSLKDFARTGSTVKVLFLESSPNARFGTAKVVQVLQHNGIRNYIVVTLDTLLKLETLFASAVLNGNSENFLILECDSDNQKYSPAQHEQAFQMLNRIANKLILVAQEDNSFTQLFIKLTVPDATKFQQLCDKSQDSFLNRELSFQGVRTNIRSVVKEDVRLVTDTLFTQLFENEEISIDCNNEWMVRMPDFIPRTLYRSVAFTESELIDRVAKVPEILVAVHGRVMSELVVRVLNQKLKQRLNDDSFMDRFFFIKSDGMDDFRERNNGLAMVRVKQLSHDAKFLVEEMISNGLDDHEKYRMFTTQEFFPRTIADFSKFKNDNILLVGEAGMGKSTYLNELAYRTKADEPHLWITKINLNDYTDILKEASDGDTVDYETLLIELATDHLTEDYERIVFCKKYNDDEVVLILDGLDEISPTFSDMSIGLLNFALEQPSKKLIVATRLHLCDSLRSHLQEDAFYFQPLTVAEQKIYLKMKWLDGLATNSSFTEDSFDLFINTLFTNIFSQKQSTKISSVPLLLSFIAEIFKTDFRLFHDTLDMGSVRLCSGHYNIVNLYDDFIDLKVRRYKEDKNRASTSNVGTAKLYEIVCPLLRDALRNVALRQFPQFYSVDHLGILDEKVKNLFPHEELIRVGLLQSVRANFEGLHFVHFSFTEYFIAEVLAERCEKFPKPGIFQTLLDISPNVSMFFDLMLSRGLPLHLAILLDDRTQFEPEKFDKKYF
ncbi:uncharacterized protein LOC119083436 [Bradysia coprophila]|uniref:uncharacterized protein LOC119083436 n=1 Tax=Bradysia coprophila TaxID=38358 RepID=UPI00187D966A|nr:uncharacterized protein LOC119083436 [Bradysia coprophila]XP_037049055.1 uncharacterized protein LOC119083436 [Bradysia coprophila]XP_037049056.1 uncharacterized protein LOC119083436 [Bradysia coprophila]